MVPAGAHGQVAMVPAGVHSATAMVPVGRRSPTAMIPVGGQSPAAMIWVGSPVARRPQRVSTRGAGPRMVGPRRAGCVRCSEIRSLTGEPGTSRASRQGGRGEASREGGQRLGGAAVAVGRRVTREGEEGGGRGDASRRRGEGEEREESRGRIQFSAAELLGICGCDHCDHPPPRHPHPSGPGPGHRRVCACKVY